MSYFNAKKMLRCSDASKKIKEMQHTETVD